MTFLKKLGQVLAQGIAVVTGIWPLVAPFFGSKTQQAGNAVSTVVNDLTNIAQVITSAEAMNQTPGSGVDKLRGASPLVYNILVTSEAFAGHKVADPPAAQQAATELTSALADFMNALSPDGIKTAGNPLPAPAPLPPTKTA